VDAGWLGRLGRSEGVERQQRTLTIVYAPRCARSRIDEGRHASGTCGDLGDQAVRDSRRRHVGRETPFIEIQIADGLPIVALS
jgi:hypothetical protein